MSDLDVALQALSGTVTTRSSRFHRPPFADVRQIRLLESALKQVQCPLAANSLVAHEPQYRAGKRAENRRSRQLFKGNVQVHLDDVSLGVRCFAR